MAQKPGRNEPCPCGSGKKFKRCCGREVPAAALSRPASAASLVPAEMRQLTALLRSGEYLELERRARALTRQYPASGFVWKALGVALQMQAKDPLAALETAARLAPDDPETHRNLGIALLAAGRTADSPASFRRALSIKPDYVEAYVGLGTALLHLGQLDGAVAGFRHALAIRPELAEAHLLLGDALLGLGQPGQAAASYRRALQIRSDLPTAWNNLGNVLRGQGRLDEAVQSYHRALEITPDYAGAHTDLGIALRLQGRADEAEASCRRALEINPNSAATLAVMAEARADKGEFAEAEELFNRALSLQPNLTEALTGIARLRKMTCDDAPWLLEAQRMASLPLRPRELISLGFAIGKYFDDVQDFDQAWASYQRANELAKLHTPGYDRRKMVQAVDQLIQFWGRERTQRSHSQGAPSSRPVFIVGMPRSGTSLAEQILASHPQVFGAGELMFWRTAAATYRFSARGGALGNGAVENGADDNDAADVKLLTGIRDDYLQLLQALSPEAPRVIDKMPGNFMFLGLIRAALPGARIIHMRRHPIDTCLSIYFQDFGTVLSYANDLEDLAHYYGEYRRVMQHWQSVLPPNAILDVPYEGLVEDQEAWSRRMLAFIDLPWDPQCLDFHRTSRSVVTTSRWQVRQRISNTSVARWRRYETYVGALKALTAEA